MQEKERTWVYWLNVVIALSLMVFIRFIPAPEPLTPQGMLVAGLFIGMVYGWCTTSMIWPSCAALTIFGLSMENTVPAVWSQAWGSPIVIFLIFLMTISALLSESGLNGFITDWVLSRKITRGRPWVFVLAFMLANMLSSMVIGAIASVIVFWRITHTICQKIGYKKGDDLPAYLCFGIVFLGGVGTIALPFQTPVITNFAVLFAAANGAITSYDYVAYLLFALPMALLALLLFVGVGRFIIKPDVEPLKQYNPDEYLPAVGGKGMDARQKIGAVVFGLLVVLLLAPSFLKGNTSLVAGYILRLGEVGSTALVLGILGVILYQKRPFVLIEKLINAGVFWGLIFMLTAAMFFAGKLTSPDTGITAFLMILLQPLLATVGKAGFIFLLMLATIVLTNMINNVAVQAIFIPLAYSICGTLDINPYVFMVMFIFVVDFAIYLPSASPLGALMHNSDGWIAKKQIYKWGLLTLLLELVLVIVIGYPLGNLVF
ncbi:MAG: anion permease [Gracilibacteraceae bacterium]|jgi:sodium-dependent dicarboxylate transporter 2/3/5|nr:anion permease [Gracilibacteraceae bacterium]